MLQYVRAKSMMDMWGEFVTTEARRNLGSVTKRRRVRSKWDGMQPISSKVSYMYKDYIATSALWESIGYDYAPKSDGKTFRIVWEMLGYGEAVDEGRDAGKWPDQDFIKQWLKEDRHIPITREVLTYDPNKKKMVGTGRYKFVKRKNYMYNQVAFLVARKIAYFGIDGSAFFSEPFEQSIDMFSEQFLEAVVEDFIDEAGPRKGSIIDDIPIYIDRNILPMNNNLISLL